MSDRATIATLRTEALAWHARAARLQEALEKIYNLAGDWTARDDNTVRYQAFDIARQALGLDDGREHDDSRMDAGDAGHI